MYSEEYLSTMSSLKQYLETKTYTEEALQVTEEALSLLASHYTAWCFRLDIIKHLGKDLFEELNWCEEVAIANEKNYQIWNYRQRVIELILEDPALAAQFQVRRELPIFQMMISMDEKNHHVWLYRNWFVKRFKLYDDSGELEFVNKLIDKDARNNSAWTHKFFLLFSRNDASENIVAQELVFCKEKIALCPQNPSLWNYLLGIYASQERLLVELKDFCEQYANINDEEIQSSFALETLAKIAVKQNDVLLACCYYDLLLQKYDPIRASYWNYLSKKILLNT